MLLLSLADLRCSLSSTVPASSSRARAPPHGPVASHGANTLCDQAEVALAQALHRLGITQSPDVASTVVRARIAGELRFARERCRHLLIVCEVPVVRSAAYDTVAHNSDVFRAGVQLAAVVFGMAMPFVHGLSHGVLISLAEASSPGPYCALLTPVAFDRCRAVLVV